MKKLPAIHKLPANKSFLGIFTILTIATTSHAVIYGEDNRVPAAQYPRAEIRELAKSTAAMMHRYLPTHNADGSFTLNTTSLKKAWDMCPTDPLIENMVASYCSGFLLDSQTIVTAGHCVPTQRECDDYLWFFDYDASRLTAPYQMSFQPSQVYACAELVHTEAKSSGADLAIIRLDREVTDRKPLVPRQSGQPRVGEELVLIGNPAGIPTIVADQGKVRKVDHSKFVVTTVDAFGGNSGSAVLNAVTGEVEGILVRGENDDLYDDKNQCFKTRRCADDKCRGEDVTRIGLVLPYLKLADKKESSLLP